MGNITIIVLYCVIAYSTPFYEITTSEAESLSTSEEEDAERLQLA